MLGHLTTKYMRANKFHRQRARNRMRMQMVNDVIIRGQLKHMPGKYAKARECIELHTRPLGFLPDDSGKRARLHQRKLIEQDARKHDPFMRVTFGGHTEAHSTIENNKEHNLACLLK